MSASIIAELERRFNVIQFKPRNFQFWTSISDFVDFIRSTPSLKRLIDEDAQRYRDAAGTIYDISQEDRQKHTAMDNCEHGHKIDKEALSISNKLHASEISKIESLSLYCHFIDLELIFDAMQEMANKHTVYTRESKCDCTDDAQKYWQKQLTDGAVKFEKELTEIHHSQFYRNNELLRSADRFYKSVEFVYRKIVNALSIANIGSQKPALDFNVPLSFDSKTGVLVVAGINVGIKRQKSRNYGHTLLLYIFQSREESHTFSDLYEKLTGGEYLDKKDSWKLCYRACQAIQSRVAEDTDHQITDFLEYGSGIKGEVNINPKYLAK